MNSSEAEAVTVYMADAFLDALITQEAITRNDPILRGDMRVKLGEFCVQLRPPLCKSISEEAWNLAS